jgi:hypothetical protein
MMSLSDLAIGGAFRSPLRQKITPPAMHPGKKCVLLEVLNSTVPNLSRGTVSRVKCQWPATRRPSKGDQMEMGNEAAAAILVQTIILKDGRLQALMGDQACKGPVMAVEFIRPFYAAALAMITSVAGELALATA